MKGESETVTAASLEARFLAGEALPEKHRRSIAKAISWRVVGSLDTLGISYVVMAFLLPALGFDPGMTKAQMLGTASYIALAEVITKIALFYVHDRIWLKVRWNIHANARGNKREGAKRSAAKTFTWRLLASIDTSVLAFVFTGHPGAALTIGGLEVWTKLALFFVHERVWQRIPFGIDEI